MTANSVLGQDRAVHYRDCNTFVKVHELYVQPQLEFAVPAWILEQILEQIFHTTNVALSCSVEGWEKSNICSGV
jgi:hypothetical protein